MKKWNGYLYLNGEEESLSLNVTFDVPQKLYARMQSAIRREIPLKDCPFYHELIERMERSVDMSEYVDMSYEKPQPEEYDSREDYLVDLEMYQQELESAWENWMSVSEDIEDPGDLPRLKKQFVGKTFEACAAEESVGFCWEVRGEKSVRYTVDIDFEGEGTVKDIRIREVEGLETEDVRGACSSEAYPDYEYLTQTLEKALRTGKEPQDEWL